MIKTYTGASAVGVLLVLIVISAITIAFQGWLLMLLISTLASAGIIGGTLSFWGSCFVALGFGALLSSWIRLSRAGN